MRCRFTEKCQDCPYCENERRRVEDWAEDGRMIRHDKNGICEHDVRFKESV